MAVGTPLQHYVLIDQRVPGDAEFPIDASPLTWRTADATRRGILHLQARLDLR